jgi:hypothetical protein
VWQETTGSPHSVLRSFKISRHGEIDEVSAPYPGHLYSSAEEAKLGICAFLHSGCSVPMRPLE